MAQPLFATDRVSEQSVRDGLPVARVAPIAAALGVSTTDIVEWLHVSPRTWARRKQSGRFDALESDRLARLVRLLTRCTDLLGGPDEARIWLTTPARALGRRTPLEVASTEIGAERVFDLLGRIEHGVFT